MLFLSNLGEHQKRVFAEYSFLFPSILDEEKRSLPGFVALFKIFITHRRFTSEVESRTQGSRPRPRTQKKIRSQGQPNRVQTLSRPRTGMLEAKAKDQGHKRKCSPKKIKNKRSSEKSFRRSPEKTVFQKLF